MGLADRLAAKLEMVGEPQPELLLCPPVPRPLHGVAPRIVLGQEWWDIIRKAAYASTNFHCQACGVHKSQAKYHQWLEAHELYEVDYIKGRLKYVKAVPLCHSCHSYIHLGRLWNLMQQGQVSKEKFMEVWQHGQALLIKAGLPHPTYAEIEEELVALERSGKMAPWQKWRLCIGRKRYPPLYPTYETWVVAQQKYKNGPVENE